MMFLPGSTITIRKLKTIGSRGNSNVILVSFQTQKSILKPKLLGVKQYPENLIPIDLSPRCCE